MERKFEKKRIIKIAVSVIAFAVIAWLMMSGRMEGFDHAVIAGLMKAAGK